MTSTELLQNFINSSLGQVINSFGIAFAYGIGIVILVFASSFAINILIAMVGGGKTTIHNSFNGRDYEI